MSKSIPAAESQNFVDTLGPQKPTWTKFFEFEFFLSKKDNIIDMTRGKNEVGLTSSSYCINLTMKLLIKS